MNVTIKSQTLGGVKQIKITKAKPIGERPKTYKEIETIVHNIGNSFNSSSAVLLKTKNNEYKIEIYRDGCFYPYYCNFNILN